MNARSQRLTGAARCDSLGWVKREWKGAVHASGFWQFLSVRIVGYMGGTGGHHHLRSPKNVSKRWGSPQKARPTQFDRDYLSLISIHPHMSYTHSAALCESCVTTDGNGAPGTNTVASGIAIQFDLAAISDL